MTTDTHEHASLLTHGAIAGGALAGAGAFIRALQTPQSWRPFVVCVLTGMLFGSGAAVTILWKYPDVPIEVAVMASAFVGFVSTHLSQVFIKLTDGFFDRLAEKTQKRIDVILPPETKQSQGGQTLERQHTAAGPANGRGSPE